LRLLPDVFAPETGAKYIRKQPEGFVSHPLGTFEPMAKAHTTFRCTTCGSTAPRWVGRCPSCGEWSSLVAEVTRPLPAAVFGVDPVPPEEGLREPVPIGQVAGAAWQPVPT